MAEDAWIPNQAVEQLYGTVRNKVSRLMALLNLKTRDAMTLLVVATAIMVFALSLCFGQESGAGTSCIGTLQLLCSYHFTCRQNLALIIAFHFAADCARLPERCTPDSCRQKCVSLGHTNFTTDCHEIGGRDACCCTYDCKQTPPSPLWGGWSCNFLCTI